MEQIINNRDGNKLSLRVENESARKLAFLLHGLHGSKDDNHVRSMIEAFIEGGYCVVSFDAIHGVGKSIGGLPEDATVSNYMRDLEDVIEWAANQIWYSEPFILCGHSLGGISTALYASRHPAKVRALAPISSVISGEQSLQSQEADFDQWKRDGIKISRSHDGKRIKRVKWSHMEDRLKYDLLKVAHKLTMPTLLIVGSHDTTTPPEHQQLLFEKLPGDKKMHVIEGALHSFYEANEREELKNTIKNWLQAINN